MQLYEINLVKHRGGNPDCDTAKGEKHRAATYTKWASDAADQAMTKAKWANAARDNARDQMRWAKEALDKAKR